MSWMRVAAGALVLLLVPVGAWVSPGASQGSPQTLAPPPVAAAKPAQACSAQAISGCRGCAAKLGAAPAGAWNGG